MNIVLYVIFIPLIFADDQCLLDDDVFLQHNHSSIPYIQSFHPWVPNTFPRCWESIKRVICDKPYIPFLTTSLITLPLKINLCLDADSHCKMLTQDDEWKRNIKCDQTWYPVYYNKSLSRYGICGGYLKAYRSPSPIVHWQVMFYNNRKEDHYCSLPCNSSLHRYKATDRAVYLPMVMQGGVVIIACMFTIMSFLIDWKNQKRYPAAILLILNCCYFCCMLGWMLQFMGTAQKISCDSNNERRVNEPKSWDSLFCILSFVLIYFSIMSISGWSIILMYSWNISFKSLGSTEDSMQGKVKYFHLITWLMATLITIVVVLTEKVSAHSITDICFTDHTTQTELVVFVVAPLVVCVCLGGVLLISCIRYLIKLKASCSIFLIHKATQNLTRTIYRLALYGIVMLVSSLASITCLFHEHMVEDGRKLDHSKYIMCKIIESYRPTPFVRCNKPRDYRLLYLHVQFTSLCASSIVTSSWTWTYATLKIWKKLFQRCCGKRKKPNENIQWFQRINKKKIRPFTLAIDPNEPFNSHFPANFTPSLVKPPVIVEKRNSLQEFISDFNKRLHRNPTLPHGARRRSSDDIRTVMELFSARRGTRMSIESIYSVDGSTLLPPIGKKFHHVRSKSLSSLQSVGHLTANTRMRRRSSNLKVVPWQQCVEDDEKFLPAISLAEMSRDVYTPLSLVHKNNIVADCVPNNKRNSASVSSSNKISAPS